VGFRGARKLRNSAPRRGALPRAQREELHFTLVDEVDVRPGPVRPVTRGTPLVSRRAGWAVAGGTPQERGPARRGGSGPPGHDRTASARRGHPASGRGVLRPFGGDPAPRVVESFALLQGPPDESVGPGGVRRAERRREEHHGRKNGNHVSETHIRFLFTTILTEREERADLDTRRIRHAEVSSKRGGEACVHHYSIYCTRSRVFLSRWLRVERVVRLWSTDGTGRTLPEPPICICFFPSSGL
jgi:hypothetical protein